jgi:hypothetical protein
MEVDRTGRENLLESEGNIGEGMEGGLEEKGYWNLREI